MSAKLTQELIKKSISTLERLTAMQHVNETNVNENVVFETLGSETGEHVVLAMHARSKFVIADVMCADELVDRFKLIFCDEMGYVAYKNDEFVCEGTRDRQLRRLLSAFDFEKFVKRTPYAWNNTQDPVARKRYQSELLDVLVAAI
jgi:hypothetical protein